MTTPCITPQKSPTSKHPDLHHLLQVHFIQQALFELLEQKKLESDLLVVNHQDRYLSLSNEDYYIVVMTEMATALLSQVEEELGYIFQRKKIIVHLQQRTDRTTFSTYRGVSVAQLRERAEGNGVPGMNLFLFMLERVFS